MLLGVSTGGLFQFWWLHQNWMVIRDRFGERVSPFLRTLFGVFVSYGLFARVDREAKQRGLSLAVGAAPLAVAYFVGALVGGLTGGLLAVAGALPLLPVNGLMARLNQQLAPDTPPRVGWTTLNVVWVALFSLLVLASALRSAR